MKGPSFEGDGDLASSKEFCATMARMLEQLDHCLDLSVWFTSLSCSFVGQLAP